VIAFAVLALIVALALQVGVNYANDYSDGIRGTDAERVGPVRLVGQGLAEPGNVKIAAFAAFGLAALAGLALVGLAEAWALLPIGILRHAAVVLHRRQRPAAGPAREVMVWSSLVATLGTNTPNSGTVGTGPRHRRIASAILVPTTCATSPPTAWRAAHPRRASR
jgi:1,4-dihydroxy-2-naphthoate octaprenyltransferase